MQISNIQDGAECDVKYERQMCYHKILPEKDNECCHFSKYWLQKRCDIFNVSLTYLVSDTLLCKFNFILTSGDILPISLF